MQASVSKFLCVASTAVDPQIRYSRHGWRVFSYHFLLKITPNLGVGKLMRSLKLLALLLSLTAFASAQRPQMPDKFTNLKVLPKDISKDDLISMMKTFTRSLGIRCDHCHEINEQAFEKSDFASDKKPEKDVARTMIKMNHEINDEFISKVKLEDDPPPKPVNCWTCHRGHVKPETGPPPPPERKPGEAPPGPPPEQKH